VTDASPTYDPFMPDEPRRRRLVFVRKTAFDARATLLQIVRVAPKQRCYFATRPYCGQTTEDREVAADGTST
jgi:hypothetical protein